MTYAIETNPPRITCLRCMRTSYNLNDVERKYCGHCHEFHTDGEWTVEGQPVSVFKCVALLLAIAFDGKMGKEAIQEAVKKFLAEVPPEVVARAAGTRVEF